MTCSLGLATKAIDLRIMPPIADAKGFFDWISKSMTLLTIPPTLHPRAIEWEPTFLVTLSHVTQIRHVFFQFIYRLDTFSQRYISLPYPVLVRPEQKENKLLYLKLEYCYANSITKELCNTWLFKQPTNVSLCDIGNGCKEASHGL